MRNKFFLLVIFCVIILTPAIVHSESPRSVIDLNGKWEFEQTETAFPPKKFTRIIPVPGLIDLAELRIEQYNKYFSGTHEPRYSWYRCTFSVSPENRGRFSVLNLLKSRFNTQVILNGHDLGTYMECNTPIECNITDFLNFEDKNVRWYGSGNGHGFPNNRLPGLIEKNIPIYREFGMTYLLHLPVPSVLSGLFFSPI